MRAGESAASWSRVCQYCAFGDESRTVGATFPQFPLGFSEEPASCSRCEIGGRGFCLCCLSGRSLPTWGFGAYWLFQHGWLIIAGSIWVATGIVFGFLAAGWTRSQTPILPPIDWDAPQTFAKIDRDAWAMVEKEAELGESVSLEGLTEFDLYINTGRRLAAHLAEHYHPLSSDPLQTVPVVERLDRSGACGGRPQPALPAGSRGRHAHPLALEEGRSGGRICPARNEIYSFLLPIFSPVNGLVRLGTQQLMTKPAWRDMQQNLLRWFFRAYVNRLGTHLIELYSGRLAIGADQYRRLTRRGKITPHQSETECPPLRIAIAGTSGVGKSRVLTMIEQARSGDLTLLKARLSGSGIEPGAIDRLHEAKLVEIRGYSTSSGDESARDRATRADALHEAVEADLLILVTDLRRATSLADSTFAQDWNRWFVEHPGIELPPAFTVLTGLDDSAADAEWKPPYDWERGQGSLETAVRGRVKSLQAVLPPSLARIIPLGKSDAASIGVSEGFLPTLLTLLPRSRTDGSDPASSSLFEPVQGTQARDAGGPTRDGAVGDSPKTTRGSEADQNLKTRNVLPGDHNSHVRSWCYRHCLTLAPQLLRDLEPSRRLV